jgi:GT2 family glycosyltransferase
MNSPHVGIVILNWNGKNWLEKFLPLVMASTYENKKIIVADNASTDDSVDFVKRNFPTIEIILNPTNEGFAKGYNTALTHVKADIFVLLNSDVAVTPNWIEPIVTLMQSDHTIAACQPKVLSYDNKAKFEYAGAAGGYIDKYGYPLARGRVFDFCEHDEGQYNTNEPIFWASGAALFIQSKVYHKLNGLDEDFFAHQEEIDLCWRVQLLGYKVFVCTASTVFHVGGGTLQQGSVKKTYLNFRNNLMMISKNLSGFHKFSLVFQRFVLNNIAALQFLMKGELQHSWAVIKAFYHFLLWKPKDQFKVIAPKPKLIKLTGVVPKSIVYNFFIKKKKTFKEIVDN